MLDGADDCECDNYQVIITRGHDDDVDEDDDNDEDEDDHDDDNDGEDDDTISRYSLNGSSWHSTETIDGEVFWDIWAVLGLTVFCLVVDLLQVIHQKCTLAHSTT